MNNVYIIGVGISRLGKFKERPLRSFVEEVVTATLNDSGISKEDLQAAWVGNAGWGLFEGQESIRGQVALRPLGIDGIPIMNVENACATGSSAVHGAWLGIRAGVYDCALALGVEKMTSQDPSKVFQALLVGTDVLDLPEMIGRVIAQAKIVDERMAQAGMGEHAFDFADGVGVSHGGAMDLYALVARDHMLKYGSTQRQLAIIASKNHWHSSMNPNAQYQKEMSVDEVMNDREISWPLTRSMCAPIGDGAAAAVLCSEEFLKDLKGARPVKVRASVVASGREREFGDFDGDIAVRASRRAYEMAGVGPEDIDVAEVHDASSFGELHQTEALGFCPEGEGGAFAESGRPGWEVSCQSTPPAEWFPAATPSGPREWRRSTRW